MAGQSNMAGADAVIDEPPGFRQIEADRETLFTCAPGPGDVTSQDYAPWGEICGHRAYSPRHQGRLVHGPEVGFARRLHEAGVRDIAIIKVWANFGRDTKSWPWAEGGDYYQRWTKFVDDRLAELKRQGKRYEVRGFIWHQGIDDGLNRHLAPAYRANLTSLIGALRKRYGNPTTPFILARGVTGSGPADPMSLGRKARVAVAQSDLHAAWIDVDDLPNVGTHHFTAAGQLVVGRRFAEAYLSLIGKGRTTGE